MMAQNHAVALQQSNEINTNNNQQQVQKWILELMKPETRDNALMELSKLRENVPDLAIMLWHSFGVVSLLLQEITMVYPTLYPPTLSVLTSNRCCNALALLQCICVHPHTRSLALEANLPLYLYPILQTTTPTKTRPYEYLRLTSLGVIGALVKVDEAQVINFLLSTEIIPLCLCIMESGSELCKTVATFILQKILLDETGLSYICRTFERFHHVATILGNMVASLARDPDEQKTVRLLKHVIRCYLRLSDNPRAREALKQCLPVELRDNTFSKGLQEDKSTANWLTQLLNNLETTISTVAQS